MKYALNENWIDRITQSNEETEKQKQFKQQLISSNSDVSKSDKDFV